MAAHEEAQSSVDSQVEKLLGYARFPLALRVPPPTLSLFNRGAWNNIDPVFRISRLEPALVSPESADGSWLDFVFPAVDLSFAMVVLFSFVPFLFGCDCICAERQSGTLRLVLVNPISSFTLVAGKLVGQAVALLAPLCFWWLICQLWILSTPSLRLRMGAHDWWAFHRYSLLVAAYALLMLAVAVLASALSRRRSSAIVGLLLFWLATLALLPGIGFSIAQLRIPSQPSREFSERRSAIDRQILESYLAFLKKAFNAPLDVPERVLDSPGIESIHVTVRDQSLTVFRNGEIWLNRLSPEYRKQLVESLFDLVSLQRGIVSRKRALYDERLNRMLAQWRFAGALRFLAPAWLFLETSAEVVGTGPAALEGRYHRLAASSQQFYDELIRSDRFNSPLFFLSPLNAPQLRQARFPALSSLEAAPDRFPLDSAAFFSTLGYYLCAAAVAVVGAFAAALRMEL